MIGCADGNLRIYSCHKAQMRLLGFAFRETMKMMERDFRNVEMFYWEGRGDHGICCSTSAKRHFEMKVFLIHQRKQFRVEINTIIKLLSLPHRGT